MSCPSSSSSSQAKAAFHRSDDAKAYRDNASFVYSSQNTAPVLALLDAQPGERILDLGCGSGELTRVVASLVAGAGGSVLGVDASQDMVDAATASTTSDTVPASFALADGCDLCAYLSSHGLTGTFDRVLSNAALHWMKRSPGAALRGVHAALRPGGTFAAELGGFLNVISIRGGCHALLRRYGVAGADPRDVDPWYFPTAEAYAGLLAQVGLTVDSCELVPRPTPLPTGIRGFLRTFCGPFLNELPSDEARDEGVAWLEELLRPDMYDEGADQWTAMYVRLRVKATKPLASATAAADSSLPPSSTPAPTTTPTSPSTAPLSPSLVHKLLSTSPSSPTAQAAAQRIHARFLNRTVIAHIPDGRAFRGEFVCIDDARNLILSRADELRLHGAGASTSVEDASASRGGGGAGAGASRGGGDASAGGDASGSGSGDAPPLSTEDRTTSSRFVGMVMIQGRDLLRLEVEEDVPVPPREGGGGGGGAWRGGQSHAAWPIEAGAYM